MFGGAKFFSRHGTTAEFAAAAASMNDGSINALHIRVIAITRIEHHQTTRAALRTQVASSHHHQNAPLAPFRRIYSARCAPRGGLGRNGSTPGRGTRTRTSDSAAEAVRRRRPRPSPQRRRPAPIPRRCRIRHAAPHTLLCAARAGARRRTAARYAKEYGWRSPAVCARRLCARRGREPAAVAPARAKTATLAATAAAAAAAAARAARRRHVTQLNCDLLGV